MNWDAVAASITPRRREGVREYELDGGCLLYDEASRKLYELSESAEAIWRRCDGSATLHEIAQRQTDVFDVDSHTALTHAAETMLYFSEEGLVEEVILRG